MKRNCTLETYAAGATGGASTRRAGGGGGRAATCRATARRATDNDIGGACAEVTLGGNDLVVECAHVEASTLPCVEVVAGGDGPSRALALADGPVLVEG